MKDVITEPQFDKAVAAAIVEAGWSWEPGHGVPTPTECMEPVVLAALETLSITVNYQ